MELLIPESRNYYQVLKLQIFNFFECNFFEACENGKVEVVRYLLDKSKGEDINETTNDGISPLYVACFYGHIEIVKLLLSNRKIDVNKAKKDGRTPFFIACQKGYVNIVKFLLNDSRVKVNQPDNTGETPYGISHRSVLELLSSDAKVVKIKNLNNSNLEKGRKNGEIDTSKSLKNSNAMDIDEVKNDNQTSFFIACQNGHTNIVKFLLNDSRIDVNMSNNNGETPFFIACQNGHTEIVNLLFNNIKVGINKANNYGVTPLEIAYLKGHIEILKFMLHGERKLNLNTKGSDGNSINIATKYGKKNIEELLNSLALNVHQGNGIISFLIFLFVCFYK